MVNDFGRWIRAFAGMMGKLNHLRCNATDIAGCVVRWQRGC